MNDPVTLTEATTAAEATGEAVILFGYLRTVAAMDLDNIAVRQRHEVAAANDQEVLLSSDRFGLVIFDATRGTVTGLKSHNRSKSIRIGGKVPRRRYRRGYWYERDNAVPAL